MKAAPTKQMGFAVEIRFTKARNLAMGVSFLINFQGGKSGSFN
jgi:hypothetical protein